MGSFLRPQLESLEGRETPVFLSSRIAIAIPVMEAPNVVVFPPGDTDLPPEPPAPTPPPSTPPVVPPTEPIVP